ncbi:MerR family transcriptional regulator [Streptomyces roseifaciens]|uniref:MerR family transcriptional regulator n=1 Tax=Streptomyces roseifaciens TaxID=1488406 RepID=UPI000717F66E|nr:MerR family transcriptional regulator [Streptomyces roseifaciens]
MSEHPGRPEQPHEYRIEDLAHRSGATVRTIRAYQDRGLLPKPERRGRANVYRDAHLARLHQVAGLLDRGYTLASIKELLDAWDTGRGLGGVLGLVAEVDGPWTDEETGRITRAELDARFGGIPDDDAVEDAVQLGVLVRVPGPPEEFLVPSPQELAVAAELHAAGVPLAAITGHLRELRTRVEHIAGRFLDFTTEYVFRQYLDHSPTDEEAAEAAALVRRLRPLAQQTVDAELARAMRAMATRYLRDHLDGETAVGTTPGGGDTAGPAGGPAGSPADPVGGTAGAVAAAAAAVGSPGSAQGAVRLPEGTVQAVAALVGPGNVAAFIAAAAEREVRARTMDALVTRPETE